MKLIVGLGNPGVRYEKTRHNAGFRAVRSFYDTHSDIFNSWKIKWNAEVSEGKIGRKKIALLLPQTFMNDSGGAVQSAMQFWKLSAKDILIVYDDIDLPLGKIRLRASGSAGGQRGMQSVIDRVGTKDIARLRIGIGPQGEHLAAEDFVMKIFSKEEEKIFSETLEQTEKAINAFIEKDIIHAMNEWN